MMYNIFMKTKPIVFYLILYSPYPIFMCITQWRNQEFVMVGKEIRQNKPPSSSLKRINQIVMNI